MPATVQCQMPICRLLSVSFFGHLDGRSAQSPLGMQQHYEAARPKCYSTLGRWVQDVPGEVVLGLTIWSSQYRPSNRRGTAKLLSLFSQHWVAAAELGWPPHVATGLWLVI